MKKGLVLDKVVLLGRTFEEYARYFALEPAALANRAILDVAAGVSSFCAEGSARGFQITALDPIYQWPAERILQNCEPDLDRVIGAIDGLQTYKWDYYKTPEDLKRLRQKSDRLFLADFARRAGSYIAGSLPQLPFATGQFELTLVSYLLFAYEDQLDYEFHRRSLQEIMRVTRGEARLYPLVTFEARRSVFVDRLIADPALKHLSFEEIPTDFEFLVGSNGFLKIRHGVSQ
ncbi:MAG: hypothetical protein QOF48_2084 [Verrucomicrobiota bacterium]|jgi:SAM-dependent methyltransferase